MNNIFSFSRFGNYFCYDLRNSAERFLLSLLINGILPLIIYIFFGLFHLTLDGSWEVNGSAVFASSLIVALLTMTLTMPVKIYGGITDKKEGSNYLMLPASSFEKFVSMMLVILVVAPLIFCCLFFVSTSVLGLVDSSFKDSIAELDYLRGVIAGFGIPTGFSTWFSFFLSYAQSVLIFLLGAICFKRGKVGKTILTLAVISMVMSLFASTFLNTVDYEGVLNFLAERIGGKSAEEIFDIAITISNIVEVLIMAALMVAIYFRIKTLKH